MFPLYSSVGLTVLTSFAHDPAIRKLPGNVGGLNAKQDMLSSGGDVTSISYKGQKTNQN